VILDKDQEDDHEAISAKILEKERSRTDFEWPRELRKEDFPYAVIRQQPSIRSAIGIAQSSRQLKYKNPFTGEATQPSKPQ